MSLDPISYYLPFKRLGPRNRERLEDALRQALGGGSFRVTEDLDGSLEYALRFAPGKGRGAFTAEPGDEESGASLVVYHEDGAAQDERTYDVLAEVARRLGGWDEDHRDEMVAALCAEPLPTWPAACACAADEFELLGEGEGWFAVAVDPDEGQHVRAALFEDEEGAGWIVLRAPALPREALDPRAALELNATQDFATLALGGDEYELVYSFPLEALTRGLLCDLLLGMADEAAALREDVAGDE